MPFLKCRHKFVPLNKQWENQTYKTGLRRLLFNLQGDRYIGEWKNNKKDGEKLNFFFIYR